MDTLKDFPERIISGFAHLVWIILLIMLMLNLDPIESITKIKDISSGAAALIASLIIVASFFLGNLFDKIIIILNRIIMKLFNIEEQLMSELIDKYKEKETEEIRDLENYWIDKAFFRSIGIAVLLIIIFSLLLNCKYEKTNYCCAIIIIGLMIEIASWIIFFD